MIGTLFFDPFHLFRGNTSLAVRQRIDASRYPNGFLGSALQLMAYYAEGRGGFYIASKDTDHGDKDLNFYKAPDDKSLVCEVAHIQGDARPGKSLIVDYPVVIAALNGRNLVRRGGTVPGLGHATGLVQAGHTSRSRGRWRCLTLAPRKDGRRGRVVALPHRHSPGHSPHPPASSAHRSCTWNSGGSHEPSRQAAPERWRSFRPVLFPDRSLSRPRTHSNATTRIAIVPPATPISPDWVAMCPVQPGWRSVVCESAEDMAGTGPQRHHQIWVAENQVGCAADCLYDDIGPCAGVPTHCYSPHHVHPPGAGREITRAYISLFEASQQRASRARGMYVPIGTECVSEPFVGCLDLYYARNAGFNPDMETFPYVRELTWLPDGHMEIVPLFPFIYHEHGPVAIQGIYPVPPWGNSRSRGVLRLGRGSHHTLGRLDRHVSCSVCAFTVRSTGCASCDAWLRLERISLAIFWPTAGWSGPPSFACGTIEINHGLAEGGWLRKIRFPRESSRGRESPRILQSASDGQRSCEGTLGRAVGHGAAGHPDGESSQPRP